MITCKRCMGNLKFENADVRIFKRFLIEYDTTYRRQWVECVIANCLQTCLATASKCKTHGSESQAKRKRMSLTLLELQDTIPKLMTTYRRQWVECVKCNENVTHSAQGETVFLGRNFLFRISEYTQRERKCSFRKQQIFISQTTDFHFANYRFSFRKLQISISQTTDFHFANYRFPFRKLQISISFRPISFRKLQ